MPELIPRERYRAAVPHLSVVPELPIGSTAQVCPSIPISQFSQTFRPNYLYASIEDSDKKYFWKELVLIYPLHNAIYCPIP